MRNFHFPGRSNVLSTKGIVATSHPLASQEALSILKMGGNAIDAAIAASAVLCVVEPNATSIGGDCFAIIAPKGKNPVSYNGSGINPEKAKLSYFIENNIKKIELKSPHSVTVTGAIKSWESMHLDHGQLVTNGQKKIQVEQLLLLSITMMHMVLLSKLTMIYQLVITIMNQNKKVLQMLQRKQLLFR